MAAPRMGVEVGPDGVARCWWCLGAPEYIDYHDRVWGRPMHDERELFEMLVLESFQSGLSWLTILGKREGFRRAFEAWDLERVATYGDRDVDRLLADAGIVRHRGKIEATIANAAATQALHDRGETLDELLWSLAPDRDGARPAASGHDLASVTPESKAMAKELKLRRLRTRSRYRPPARPPPFGRALGPSAPRAPARRSRPSEARACYRRSSRACA